ncbi:MAG: nuclear transport factor 2 family protein [Rhizomicrobium sp.]
MTPLATVKAYYGWIDTQEVERVLALFRPDAMYKRAGSIIGGADALQRFFGGERKIRGRHMIESVWAVGNTVISKGRFQGVGAAGDARDVEFVDVWTFDDCGLVERRETFLAHGHEIVRA